MDVSAIARKLKFNESENFWEAACDEEVVEYPENAHNFCMQLEDVSYWFKHRNLSIGNLLKASNFEGNFLDVGGGNGVISKYLQSQSYDVAMVEPLIAGARNANKRGVDNIICSTLCEAGFSPESIDGMGFFDVIEHVEDEVKLLKEARDLLKDGGSIYLTVPSYNCLYSQSDVFAGHFRRYDKGQLKKVLENCGFEVQFDSYIFRPLVVPIFFMRRLPYVLRKNKEVKSYLLQEEVKDHKPGGVAKLVLPVFEKILLREARDILNKKACSFGASEIIWAKKK